MVARPHPFNLDRVEKVVCSGATIAEMLKEAGFADRLLTFTHVYVEDTPVPQFMWSRVRPKAGCTVYAHVVPGKKKNPLRMVLMLAVMVAAIYTGGLALSALTPMIGATAAGIAQAVVVAAVTAVGNMLVNAIAPAPKPKNNAPGLSRGEEVYGITGIRNSANPMGAVPEIFGQMRVYPPYAAAPYTEISGQDQYLRCLFDLGPGPFDLSDFKIGDTPISNYSGVEIQFSNAATGYAMPTLYTNDVEEDQLNIELVHDEPPRVLVTRVDTDEISLDISFPSMLFIDSAGEAHGVRVEIRIDYRLVGAADWINLTPADSNSITIANWDEQGYLNANPDVRAGWHNVGLGPRGWSHWQTYGRQEGRRAWLLANGNHAFSDHATEPRRFGVLWRPGARGQYEVRLTRMTPQAVQGFEGTTQGDSFWTALRSFHFRPPVRNVNHDLVALRIKASGQLNGIVDQFNCIAKRHLPVWDGTTWTTRHTRSPAWAYVYGLRQGTARPLPDHRLDLPAFKAWADWCDSIMADGQPRRTFDARVDARSTLADFLREVGAVGRASRSMQGGKFSIARDVPQSVAAQVFTPRNSWGFSGNRTFITRPHAMKVKFQDETKGYEPSEAVVYADGYTEETATLFEVLEPFGCTRVAQGISDVRWTMAHTELRPETFSIEADIENLACTRGDLVRIAHDVIRAGIGWGRVRALTMDGGNVAGVVVDEPVSMEAGKLYAIRFRRPQGEVVFSVVTAAGEQTALSFHIPVPPSATGDVGDLFTFGEAERDSLAAVVLSIEPGRDLTATITMLPAAPELHTIDAQPIPAYTPPVTFRPDPVPGLVTDLTVSEEVVYVGGLALTRPIASWRPAPGEYAAGFDVYERREGRWNFITTTTAQRWPFDTRGRGASIEVAVIAVSSTGRKRALSEASMVFKVLDGPTTRPADVARFGHEITGAGRHRFTWVMPTTRPNFAGVRLRLQAGQGRQWESAVALHDGLVTASPYEVEAMPSGTWTVLIKAVDTDGLESAVPAAITLGLGDALAENVIETVDHRALAWPGAETGCGDVGGELLADDPGGFMYAADASAFYRATDDAPMFGADADALYPAEDLPMFTADASPMYSVVFAAMAYRTGYTPPAPGLLMAITEGDGPIGVWLRRIFPDPMFSDDTAPMFTADADPMYPSAPEAFAPLVAGTRADRQPYEIEVRIGAGTVRGRLGRFDVALDAVDVVERFDDVVVPAGGLRVTPTKPLIALRNVQLTLQADGGTAASVKTIDKASHGALIQCFDAAGAPVAGTVDVITQGY